jgi:hypothetical protein
VAVAGWQWYQSKEESRAVRMVVVRGWQWQYWLSCGSLKMGSKKNTKNSKMEVSGYQCGGSDLRSGSGGVGVEPIESGEQGGSNGTLLAIWLWQWQWQGGSGIRPNFFFFFTTHSLEFRVFSSLKHLFLPIFKSFLCQFVSISYIFAPISSIYLCFLHFISFLSISAFFALFLAFLTNFCSF